jgi:hypothetical protein
MARLSRPVGAGEVFTGQGLSLGMEGFGQGASPSVFDNTGADNLSPEFGGYSGVGGVADAGGGLRFVHDVAAGGLKGLGNLVPETAALAYRATGFAAAGVVSHFNIDVSDRMFAQYELVTGRVLPYANGLQEAAGLAAQLGVPLRAGLRAGTGIKLESLESSVTCPPPSVPA